MKVKEQLVVRNDADVNEYQTLSNITLRHKLTERQFEYYVYQDLINPIILFT
jgi:hypothetical protein